MKNLIAKVICLALFAVMTLPVEARKDVKSSKSEKSKNGVELSLPRGKASVQLDKAFEEYLNATAAIKNQELHSVMIVKDGKVVKERWLNGGEANVPHVLNSVSKTFTATAVGIAIAEGRFSLSDKVISFFPDKLPAEVSENLKKMEVRHLLSMSTGHDYAPDRHKMGADADWVKVFWPIRSSMSRVHSLSIIVWLLICSRLLFRKLRVKSWSIISILVCLSR